VPDYAGEVEVIASAAPMTDLDAQAVGELIVIIDPKNGFYAVYDKPTTEPHFHLRGRGETTDQVLTARAWVAANDKTRRA
jgi:hypothetical protein